MPTTVDSRRGLRLRRRDECNSECIRYIYICVYINLYPKTRKEREEAADLRSTILKDLPENFKEEVEVLRQAEAFEE